MSANCFLCISLHLERKKKRKTAFEKASPYRFDTRCTLIAVRNLDSIQSFLEGTFHSSIEKENPRTNRAACVIHGLKILYRLKKFRKIFRDLPTFLPSPRTRKELENSGLALPSSPPFHGRHGLKRFEGRK